MTPYTPPRRRYLSLKWKVLILSALVFGGTVSWLILRAHAAQVQQFEREQQTHRDWRAGELRVLVEQSRNRLQQLGGVVASLTDVASHLRQETTGAARAAFDRQWATFQGRVGLDRALLYDREGRLIGEWGGDPLETFPGPALNGHLVAEFGDAPGWRLACGGGACMIHVVVPLLERGQSWGTLVLAASLSEAFSSFQEVSGGVDLAMLADDAVGHPWLAHVAAFSRPERVAPILEAAARAYPDLLSLEDSVRVGVAGRVCELTAIPLANGSPEGQTRALIIDDVTEALQQIRGQAKRHLVAGFLGLAAGEFILLLLVGPPMARLGRAARVLPLLAQARYDQVRDAIGNRKPASALSPHDETDVLEQTAVALAGQLAALSKDLEEHSTALASQMKALTEERDFVSSLLDTAQVVVLTLKEDGSIFMVNRFGRELLGEAPTGRSFHELLASRDQTTELSAGLMAVARGQRARYTHEGEISTPDGQRRTVAWFHAPLARGADNSVAVLTLGMDVTARKQAESRLEWLMDHDPVTSLLNRRRFEQETASAVELAKRYRRAGAVLVVDLDKFQYINDLSGHQSGDLLLTVLSRNLRRVVRSVDVLARIGGDEFGVLARETDEAGAMELADKIRAEVSEVSVPIGGASHRVTASVGVALFPKQATDARQALAAAELAMYQAKDKGRAQVQLYSESLGTRQLLHRDVYWKDRVERALAEDGFVLHFQPIRHIATGLITHHEALLRMVDDDGQIIAPGEFIGACERTGLIHRVDTMVLGKVVAHLSQLPSGSDHARISVNLSALAFQHPEHLPALRTLLRDNHVAPERLVLEVTETATVADFAAARTLMEGLRELGCALALDDFGVGFSTLGYLKELPVDYVKIDGTFIRNLPNSPDDQILLRTMVEAAKGFGKLTIAEYVESAETLVLLERFGVDYAQGYHIGRPGPAEETLYRPNPVSSAPNRERSDLTT